MIYIRTPFSFPQDVHRREMHECTAHQARATPPYYRSYCRSYCVMSILAYNVFTGWRDSASGQTINKAKRPSCSTTIVDLKRWHVSSTRSILIGVINQNRKKRPRIASFVCFADTPQRSPAVTLWNQSAERTRVFFLNYN